MLPFPLLSALVLDKIATMGFRHVDRSGSSGQPVVQASFPWTLICLKPIVWPHVNIDSVISGG